MLVRGLTAVKSVPGDMRRWRELVQVRRLTCILAHSLTDPLQILMSAEKMTPSVLMVPTVSTPRGNIAVRVRNSSTQATSHSEKHFSIIMPRCACASEVYGSVSV